MSMFTNQIVPMANRKYKLIPVDSIRVLNSRNREKLQFDDNIRSIESIGLLKPIVVNERKFAAEGFYELVCGEGRFLAHKTLKREKIPAEVINCDQQTALLFSLVENIARVTPNTMWFAREMKRMKDCGLPIKKICDIVGKGDTYVGDYIQLVEMGEERLIKGVEQGLFPISFAAAVAKTPNETIQNVLMDAFDSGLINSSNTARVRNLIELRMNLGKLPCRKQSNDKPAYSLRELRRDITKATEEKSGFVREAAAKENRVLALLDGLDTLGKDEAFMKLLADEGLAQRPELIGTYNSQ